MGSVDSESLAQLPGSVGEVLVPSPPPRHHLDTFDGYSTSKQHSSTHALGAHNHIGAPMDAVRPVHVQPTTRPEHAQVPCPPTPERMTRRIVLPIGFDLVDEDGRSSAFELGAQPAAEQPGCDLDRVRLKQFGRRHPRSVSRIALKE